MKNRKKVSAEEKAILEAKKVRKFMEEDLKKRLSENFSNELKELISNSVLEMDDDDFEAHDADLNEEEAPEEEEVEDYDADVAPVETEPEGELEGGEEELLKDLESELEDDLDETATHEGYDGVEGEEDAFVEGEEREDDDEGLDENSFISELEKELDAIFNDEEMSEGEERDDDEKESLDEGDEKESLDEDSYENKPEDKSRHYEGGKEKQKMDEDDAYEDKPEDKSRHYEGGKSAKNETSLKKENARLKRQIREIYSELSEVTLDTARERKLREITSKFELSEKAKFNVVRQLDKAKNESQLKEISRMVESVIAGSGAKRKASTKNESARRRNKAGANSSIRKPKNNKPQVTETAKPEWVKRFLDIAK